MDFLFKTLQKCNEIFIFAGMMTTGQSLQRLFSKRAWYKNSGINGSTARIYKKRFLENRLDIKTQIKILTTFNFKLVQDMQWEEHINREEIRSNLLNSLRRGNAFWSYDASSVLQISDDKLVEMVLLYLDMDDIALLFQLFSRKTIKAVWKEKMLPQEPFYHSLNRLYAFLFFNIKDPDRYIRKHVNQQFKAIQWKD